MTEKDIKKVLNNWTYENLSIFKNELDIEMDDDSFWKDLDSCSNIYGKNKMWWLYAKKNNKEEFLGWYLNKDDIKSDIDIYKIREYSEFEEKDYPKKTDFINFLKENV